MTSPPPPLQRKTGFAKFIAGFGFALQGLAYAVRTQCNIQVHIGIAVAAIIAAVALKMPLTHIAIVILTIAIVLGAELFNTAIETIVDLVSPDYHDLAKITKDVSAAAVLVCAIGAVIVGLMLYVPAIIALF